MSKEHSIAGILLPLQQRPLLLPVACIAEVLGYHRPVEHKRGTDWILGDIRWRGLQLPLISFELFNQGRFTPFSVNNRIAVMHRTTSDSSDTMPFYAMVIQGTPRPLTLKNTELKRSSEASGPAEKGRAMLRETPVTLPDLALIEQTLEDLVCPQAITH